MPYAGLVGVPGSRTQYFLQARTRVLSKRSTDELEPRCYASGLSLPLSATAPAAHCGNIVMPIVVATVGTANRQLGRHAVFSRYDYITVEE
ncbi:hypothetical protein O181_042209 [Austropuccinia psidii MF-1]|uniref:Uncharacterized protein n=1 Tax=Austropuccinia psidii MF-1 TaxID=1389203 RepID=A0A9Q3HH90_9BASI|nr:hypothetical protein [Austropuccinia psidii MF-1]